VFEEFQQFIPTIDEQVARLKRRFNELCTIEDGEVTPRPGVTTEQSIEFLRETKRIKAIYKKMYEDMKTFEEEVNAHADSVNATRQKLVRFERERKIKIPDLMRELYDL